jgi:hypothetical protein
MGFPYTFPFYMGESENKVMGNYLPRTERTFTRNNKSNGVRYVSEDIKRSSGGANQSKRCQTTFKAR